MVYTYRASLGSEEESVQSTQPLNYTHGHFSSINHTESTDTYPGKPVPDYTKPVMFSIAVKPYLPHYLFL